MRYTGSINLSFTRFFLLQTRVELYYTRYKTMEFFSYYRIQLTSREKIINWQENVQLFRAQFECVCPL